MSITFIIFCFVQAQVDSTQYVNIFCDHVLQKWNDIAATGGGTDLKLELLKTFAEITEHCGELEKVEDKINIVYDVLMVSFIT